MYVFFKLGWWLVQRTCIPVRKTIADAGLLSCANLYLHSGSLRLDKIPPASVDDLSLPNFAASLYGEIKSPRERKYLKEDNRVRNELNFMFSALGIGTELLFHSKGAEADWRTACYWRWKSVSDCPFASYVWRPQGCKSMIRRARLKYFLFDLLLAWWQEEIGDNSWETETIDISTRRLNSVVASCKVSIRCITIKCDTHCWIIQRAIRRRIGSITRPQSLRTHLLFSAEPTERPSRTRCSSWTWRYLQFPMSFMSRSLSHLVQKFVWTCPLVNGTPPPHRCGHTATQIGKHVYVHGGKNKSGYLNDTYVFDTETVTWYRVPFNVRG